MYLWHVYASQRQGYINFESLNAARLQSAITDMVRSRGLSRAYGPHSALHFGQGWQLNFPQGGLQVVL